MIPILAGLLILFLGEKSLPTERNLPAVGEGQNAPGIYVLGKEAMFPAEANQDFLSVEKSEEHILIPKIIHQTYSTNDIPEDLQPFSRSWVVQNPTWIVKFYNDDECLQFVRAYFPEYLEAYEGLPKNIERVDFFRYMVVLKYGGIYADLDTECRVPLEKVIRSKDKLVVGWEMEFKTDDETVRRSYARRRQILQWVFAATPNHPAMRAICNQIAKNYALKFSELPDRDTLERTGPGLFTDVILEHAYRPENGVRILPRVAFGSSTFGDDGLSDKCSGIAVMHYYRGSWKAPGQPDDFLSSFVARWKHAFAPAKPHKKIHIKPSNLSLYPLAISWEPSFVAMVHPKGVAEWVDGSDVSAQLTTWGNWQAGLEAERQPRVVDALVGLLEGNKQLAVLDVGAGLGLFTLAAASKGHPVLALEDSELDRKALQASIDFNQFRSLVSVVPENPLKWRCSRLANEEVLFSNELVQEIERQGWDPSFFYARQNDSAAFDDLMRGNLTMKQIGGIRIGASDSARAHWLIKRWLGVLSRSRPRVIMVESMFKSAKQCRSKDPVMLLYLLHRMGYETIFHSGQVCDNIRQSVEGRQFSSQNSQALLESNLEDIWCALSPDNYQWIVDNSLVNQVENLIFIYRDP